MGGAFALERGGTFSSHQGCANLRPSLIGRVLREAQQKLGNVIGGGGAAKRRGGLLPLDPLAGAVCEGSACSG